MSENSVFSKKETILLFALFAAVWSFLWTKVILAPMSHDELATFFFYVQPHSILPFVGLADANNHILNSALTLFFYTLFGSSPLVLRLASLLSFIPFFIFIVKLSGFLKNSIVRWTFIIVFATSSGLIEFFALSRGYGMSMAFLLGSVYYLMQALRTNELKYYSLCLIFGLLALSANLTLLVSFLIIFIWLLMLHMLKFKPGVKRNLVLFLFYIVLALLPLGVTLKYLFILKKCGALYYGNLKGFWTLTVHSLSYLFTGSLNEVFPIIFLLLFVAMGLIFILITAKEKILKLITNPQIIFFGLLCGNIAAIIIMGKIMKVNYPEDRTGLYLFPFFTGSLCFLTDMALQIWNRKWLMLILLPLCFFPLNFLYSMNFGRCNIYIEDRFPKRFFDKIYAERKTNDFPAAIGGNSVKVFCWTYYNYRNDGSQGVVQYWNCPATDEEYQIVMPAEIPGWKNIYDSIDYDKYSGLLLLKMKHPYTRTLLDSVSILSKPEYSEEFFDLCKYKTDSLVGKTLYLGYKLTLSTTEIPFNTNVVIDISDNNGKPLVYQYICLNWLKLHYSGESQNFFNGMLIHKIPPEAATFKSYLWNLHKVPFSVKGSLYLFQLTK